MTGCTGSAAVEPQHHGEYSVNIRNTRITITHATQSKKWIITNSTVEGLLSKRRAPLKGDPVTVGPDPTTSASNAAEKDIGESYKHIASVSSKIVT